MSQLREQCLSTMSISECVINYSRGPGTHSEPPHWACSRAPNDGSRRFHREIDITEKAPTRAFTLRTLLRHNAKC